VATYASWRDCIGREVIVEEGTWTNKIIADHAELDGNELLVERTLVDPDVRNRDKEHEGREVYYRRGVLEAPFENDLLKVVVEFRTDSTGTTRGRLITAYATDRVAGGEKTIWTRRR
jgi:hypothetical protein